MPVIDGTAGILDVGWVSCLLSCMEFYILYKNRRILDF